MAMRSFPLSDLGHPPLCPRLASPWCQGRVGAGRVRMSLPSIPSKIKRRGAMFRCRGDPLR